MAYADGKQGKDIASHYQVHSNTLTTWRRKFEHGGIEELMARVPKPESKVNMPKPKASLLDDPAVRAKLIEYGISPSELIEKEPIIVLPDLWQRKVDLVGLFLAHNIQILALVLSFTLDPPLFAQGKGFCRVNDSVKMPVKASSQADCFDEMIALGSSLGSVTSLKATENPQRVSEEAFSFIERLQTSFQDKGNRFYILINATDVAAIVPDHSVIGAHVSSTEDFKEAVQIWLDAIAKVNLPCKIINDNINRLLNMTSEESEPVIWQVQLEGDQLQEVDQVQLASNQLQEVDQVQLASNRPQEVDQVQPVLAEPTPPPGGNVLTVTLSYKDKAGKTVQCTKTFVNAVPNCSKIGQCKTIYELQNRLGELEQGIVNGSKEVREEFFQKLRAAQGAFQPQDKEKA